MNTNDGLQQYNTRTTEVEELFWNDWSCLIIQKLSDMKCLEMMPKSGSRKGLI